MEESQGITLTEYLQSKGPLPGSQVAKLACHLAKTLESEAEGAPNRRTPVLHSGRIVIGAGGKVSVTPNDDSGMSLPVVAEFPSHASPEEVRGDSGDFRSSLYSLGCTLYQLLTGSPPYDDDDPKAILRSHVDAPVPDPSENGGDANEMLSRAVQELLRKDPEQRIQTSAELVRRLQSVGNGGISPSAETAETDEAGDSVKPQAAAPRSSQPTIPAAGRSVRKIASSGGSAAAKPEETTGRGPAARKIPVPGGSSASRGKSTRRGFTPRAAKGSEETASRQAGRRAAARGSGMKSARGSGRAVGAGRAGSRPERNASRRGRRAANDEGSEDAQAQYGLPRKKKTYPFTMVGVALGLILGLVVFISTRKSAERVVDSRIEKIASLEKKELDGQKAIWRERYAKEQKEVEEFLDQQRTRLAAGTKNVNFMVHGTLEKQLDDKYSNRPRAPALAALYAKLTPKAEEESGLTRPAAASASWDRILAEYKQLYDAGDYGPALEKIREGEDDFRDDTEKMAVVDRAVDDCSKMLDERWPKDEAKILDFAGQGEIEKALAVARAATRYGDPQIKRQATAMMRDIKSQAIARGVGSGGDDDDEGGKAKEGDDDDVVDFDDLDDDDDDSGE